MADGRVQACEGFKLSAAPSTSPVLNGKVPAARLCIIHTVCTAYQSEYPSSRVTQHTKHTWNPAPRQVVVLLNLFRGEVYLSQVFQARIGFAGLVVVLKRGIVAVHAGAPVNTVVRAHDPKCVLAIQVQNLESMD